jgi:protein SCO1/2
MSSSSLASKASPLHDRFAALVTRPLFWVAFLAVAFVVPIVRAVNGTVPPTPAMHLPLPAFTLTSEMNLPYGTKQLLGKVWVADFMFTSCPTACPKLSKRMFELQRRCRHLGDSFHLVSFTVDPETDTPERLAAYGKEYKANPLHWTFLTGSTEAIQTTVVKGFNIAMGREPAAPGSNVMSIFHGEKLVLVDTNGMIRGFYDADDASLTNLLRDINVVVNMPDAPDSQLTHAALDH